MREQVHVCINTEIFGNVNAVGFLLKPELASVSMLLYYISWLVRTLLLVNLAGRTLLHFPLKFKVLFVAKLSRDLSPNFLNLNSK